MAEVTREPYVFSIEGEYLRVFVDAVEVDRAALSQASCEEGRYYITLGALLMNANFSAEEWDVLNGRVLAAVEEATPVAEEAAPVAVEASVAPTGFKRRRTF